MKRFVKALIPMAVAAAVMYFLLGLILSDILYTVACALVGQEWASLHFILMILAAYIAVQLVSHRIQKTRQPEERRAYLEVLGGEVYDRKTDRKRVSRDKLYRAELIAYAVVAFVQCTATFNVISAVVVAPVMYAVFHIYNRRLWLNLHETWADERIRLNPNA